MLKVILINLLKARKGLIIKSFTFNFKGLITFFNKKKDI